MGLLDNTTQAEYYGGEKAGRKRAANRIKKLKKELAHTESKIEKMMKAMYTFTDNTTYQGLKNKN